MKLTSIQTRIFKKFNISLVYLFGSYAEGNSLSLSDIDVGVVFSDPSILDKEVGLIYNRLYDIFTDIFPGKKVDIVFLQKATLELRFDVVKHGKILYTVSMADKLNFEEKTMLSYADFKPLLTEFNQAILNRN